MTPTHSNGFPLNYTIPWNSEPTENLEQTYKSEASNTEMTFLLGLVNEECTCPSIRIGQKALYQTFLQNKKIIEIEVDLTDPEAYFAKHLNRANIEKSSEEQIIYLVNLSEIYMQKKDYFKSAKLLNCALAIFQKNLKDLDIEEFLFYRLENLEIVFLENLGIKKTHKLQRSVITYRSWLKRIRSSLVERSQQKVPIQKLLGELTVSFRELLTALILNSQKLMGPPPTKWACVGLGSMARDEMCPYSDVEFAFLIEKETPENLQYFLKLTQLIELKIINLGETKFSIFGEANESPTPDGFCLDVGGITPYGNRDTYKLIGTPQSLARFQQQEWIEENIIVSNAMGSACLVVGDTGLFEKYQTNKNAILDEIISIFGQSHRKSFALRLLKGHTAEFSPDLSKEKEELSAFGIKKELYRPFQEIIASLALFYNLKAINTFVRIDELALMGIFSSTGANNLKKVLTQVLTLRLEAHLFYRDEKEFLCHLEKDKLLDPHFMYFDEKNLKTLHEIYQVLIPFHQCGEKFLTSQSKQAFNSSPFYDKSSKVQGAAFDKNLQYAKAQEMRQQTVSLNPNDVDALLRLGLIENKMGNIQDALPRYLKALEIARKQYGENHSDVAMSYNNIGTIYDSLGNYEKGFEYQYKALKIRLQVSGKNHPDVAMSYTNIGSVYYSLGNYEKALGSFQKALKIYCQFLGENHHEVVTSYGNIGCVYDTLGNYEKALEYHQKALMIKCQVLGKQHPDVATSYGNIGSVYVNLGDNKKALEYQQKALKIWCQVLGENHLSVATSYNNIGLVYVNLGDYKKALKYQQKALKICCQVLGENHPSVATSYNNIGLIYVNLGDYEKALEYYQKALNIKLQVLVENHPDVAISYNNIGEVHRNLGDYEKALGCQHKALKIWCQILGEDHPSVATSCNNIGAVYVSLGDYEKVFEYFQKALKIQLQALGENHPNVAGSYNNIGTVYDNLGDYEKALDNLKMAVEILCKIYKQSHPNTLNALKGLINVAEKLQPSQLKTLKLTYVLCVETLGKEHELTKELSQLIGS